jgi:hypothetical protein
MRSRKIRLISDWQRSPRRCSQSSTSASILKLIASLRGLKNFRAQLQFASGGSGISVVFGATN